VTLSLPQLLEAKPATQGRNPPWLAALRAEAVERIRRNGLPTRKLEAWKFTSLGALERIAFRPANDDGAARLDKAALTILRLTPLCHLAVFVNGRFRADLSDLAHLPEGSSVTSLATASEADLRALTAAPEIASDPRARTLLDLNTAFMTDGAVIHLGPGATLDPIQLLFLGLPGGEPQVFQPRNLIVAAVGSSATVLETYASLGASHGEGVYWTNAATRVLIARNAVLRHYKLQAEAPTAYHTAETSVCLDEAAAYRMFVLSEGAALARNEIDVALAAAEAEARLSGATLARGAQHLDTTIRIDHAMPDGSSAQAFRSVVDDRAHAVFQGRIRVAPGAQKTDAQQLSRSLLLSATAGTDTKPELEILADDVKCSHGAAVGDLDKEALFYLRARGIGESEARGILIDAFVGELIAAVESEPARQYFRQALDGWLSRGGHP
jgi:Fe-S cluster assembly protein SufD